MAHYWTADDNEVARKAQIADWIEDLVEFGPTVVNEAVKDWRQTERYRPTIADIRLRCIKVQDEARERALRIEGPPRMDWTQAELLERRNGIAMQQARYVRGDFFRGKPVDWVGAVSFDELCRHYPQERNEVISRAIDLISETNQRRRSHADATGP